VECCFLMKNSLGHYNYICQIVWAVLGEIALNCRLFRQTIVCTEDCVIG
jgi:hypothetical protein